MNGKILYVEDKVSEAKESFLTGVLSNLITTSLRDKISKLNGKNQLRARKMSFQGVSQSPENNIEAKDLKEIVEKEDSRIVYHYDFIEALKFICSEFNSIELCIFDRNLECTLDEESIKKEVEALGIKFTHNDYKFIAPLDDLNSHREGNYLLEILHGKVGDDILEKTYFLSGFENDLENDRHHAYILRKFDHKHYIGKNELEKINSLKEQLVEFEKLKNYDIITKYFPDIFDVVDDKELRIFWDGVISRYERASPIEFDIVEFMGKSRIIIEHVHRYLIKPQPKKTSITVSGNDIIKIRTFFEKFIKHQDKLRAPISSLDSAYTICCDIGLHIPKKCFSQSKFLQDNLENDFLCRYVYESIKIFFVFLKYFRQ